MTAEQIQQYLEQTGKSALTSVTFADLIALVTPATPAADKPAA